MSQPQFKKPSEELILPREKNLISMINTDVLLVEDDESVLRSLERLLRRRFRNVLKSLSTEAGVTIIKEELVPNSLVISDIDNKHDEATGMDLAERSHADREIKNVPLILMSGNIQKHRHRITDLMQKGMVDATIDKPFSIQELSDVIAKLYVGG